MLRKAFFRLLSGLMALCTVLSILPAHACAASEFYVMAHSNLYQDAFPVHLYSKDGALYIDAYTLAGISGYTQTAEGNFTLAGHTVIPSRSSKISNTRCYPLELTLDQMGVRVWEKEGELYFLSGRDALQPLFEATDASILLEPIVNPDNSLIFCGTVLAWMMDTMVTWDIKPMLEEYRSAMYKLVQEDVNETTFSSLQQEWETSGQLTLSGTLWFLETFMDQDMLNELYAGSELMGIKGYLDGINLTEKALGMSLADYFRRLEEITLFFDTNVYALQAMEYVAAIEPEDSNEEQIVRTAQDILIAASKKTDGWGLEIIGQLSREHLLSLLNATASDLIGEVLLGKKRLSPEAWDFISSNLPPLQNMSGLKEAYTFSELQLFFKREMIRARTSRNWKKLKYMAIMHNRCYIASCEALKTVNMEDPTWEDQMDALQEKSMEQIARLGSIPTSVFAPFMVCNSSILPKLLVPCNGPEADYNTLAAYRPKEDGIPSVVQQCALQLWQTLCSHYGQVHFGRYGGKLYLDPGNGAALPLLIESDNAYYLTLLVQQDTTLNQLIYRFDENGTYEKVHSQPVLSLGGRDRLYLYSQSDTGLLSKADIDINIFAYAAASGQVEQYCYIGDSNADSISAMGLAARSAFQMDHGNPQWAVMVDANYGQFLFEIDHVSAIESIFHIDIP